VIDGSTLSVELATQHLGGDGHLEHVTRELAMSVSVVDVSGSFEDLKMQNEVKSLDNQNKAGERAILHHASDYNNSSLYLPGRRPSCRRSQGPDPSWSVRFQASR
jgi:hypothetical protein